MNTFHSNIISIYGEKGKVWLDELPQLVTSISSRLGLRDLNKITNLSYNDVLSGASPSSWKSGVSKLKGSLEEVAVCMGAKSKDDDLILKIEGPVLSLNAEVLRMRSVCRTFEGDLALLEESGHADMGEGVREVSPGVAGHVPRCLIS
jgi:hypothetical protein